MKENLWVAVMVVVIFAGFFVKGKYDDWSMGREKARLVNLLPELDDRFHDKLSRGEKSEAISLANAQHIVSSGDEYLGPDLYKEEVVISFMEGFDGESIKVLRVDSFKESPSLRFPVKFLEEHNPLAKAKQRCRGLGNIGEVACWEDMEYSERRWPVPPEFLEDFDEEYFRVYARGYFILDSSRIAHDQEEISPHNSVKRFYTGCEQLDIYESSAFENLVMSTGCGPLVKRAY